ncbi:protein of unknown function [Blastococcus saxobsidens DD2]|uniref:Uncharacterized protein n=1 Tax=Blastococcus saxobsidens (strain DD2) TaxID=1146883 RepID=H6RSY3_BLASD|nr:protein of unknown function [Blastococcus saxobsidens DD2]
MGASRDTSDDVHRDRCSHIAAAQMIGPAGGGAPYPCRADPPSFTGDPCAAVVGVL